MPVRRTFARVMLLGLVGLASANGCASSDGLAPKDDIATNDGGVPSADGGSSREAGGADATIVDASVLDAASGGPAPVSVTATAVLLAYSVTTLAGSGTAGFADGTGKAASFNFPSGVAMDVDGNVYVADSQNSRIRKVTPAGVVTTLAGSGVAAFADGTGAAASFNAPQGVGLDAAGNLYVGDSVNHRLRMVTPAGEVTTLAGSGAIGSVDGTGAAASFESGPHGVAVDVLGNVYAGQWINGRIRKISSGGDVTTLAGSVAGFADGTGAAALFGLPDGLAVDAVGNLYVADASNNRIRKVTPTGDVTTLAGSGANGSLDGTGAGASFFFPSGAAVDAVGNVYVTDSGGLIRRVTPAGVVTTLAGGEGVALDGIGAEVSLANAAGVAVDAAGNGYVADNNHHRICKLTLVAPKQIKVAWSPASESADPTLITGYTASARAAGQPTRMCTTDGGKSPDRCTIGGLTSGVTYSVSVISNSAAGPSAPSASVTATVPN